MLPVPEVPARDQRQVGGGAVAFTTGHNFALDGLADPGVLGEAAAAPLSVILQVTKRCDLPGSPSLEQACQQAAVVGRANAAPAVTRGSR